MPIWFFILVGSSPTILLLILQVTLNWYVLSTHSGPVETPSETPVVECRCSCSSESDLEDSYAEGFEDGVESVRDPKDPKDPEYEMYGYIPGC